MIRGALLGELKVGSRFSCKACEPCPACKACLSIHLLLQTPRECRFHLETTEFMGSSSLCALCANETPRT